MTSPIAATVAPHRAVALEGIHAYPSRESVAAGDLLGLHVSSTVDYELTICRLGSRIDDSTDDVVLARLPRCPPRPHAIYPGSYIFVARGVSGTREGLSLELWVRPWSVEHEAGLMHQSSERFPDEGFALTLTAGGGVSMRLGRRDPLVTEAGSVSVGDWHHVVATWTGEEATIYVDGVEHAAGPGGGVPCDFRTGPLRIGAGVENGVSDHFLEGDVAMPVVYGVGLDADAVRDRLRAGALEPPAAAGSEAWWPLDEESGAIVADGSGHGRHGLIVNHAAWMIGGPIFEAGGPADLSYDPAADATRGHGLRLAGDDLVDCGWPVAHEWEVPDDAVSGVHVARFAYRVDDEDRHYDVTFVVRRAPAADPASILVLCASNTWRAYNSTPFAANTPDDDTLWTLEGSTELGSRPPAYSLYRNHAAGQGTLYVGTKIPWPAAGPYVRYDMGTDYSHLVRAERYVHEWLRREGFSYDVITDLDFHRDPAILDDYRIFMVLGHPEYWSADEWRGLERFLERDGDLIMLGGNSLFWRVSVDESESVLECRKIDISDVQIPVDRYREGWHSQDGLRGGMLMHSGMVHWNLIGLTCIGWIDHDRADNFGWYVADEVEHFLFHEPDEVGLVQGQEFGWAGPGQLPMALAHEFDLRATTFYALAQELTPEQAHGPAEAVMFGMHMHGGARPDSPSDSDEGEEFVDPPGMVRLADGHVPWAAGGVILGVLPGADHPEVTQGGEIIYWEREAGGRVFNAGSIGYGWAMSVDERLATLLRNVLHHFGAVPDAAGET